MIRRHAPLVILVAVAVGVMIWAYIMSSDTLIAIAANVWGVAIMLLVFDITPHGSKEKREQR